MPYAHAVIEIPRDPSDPSAGVYRYNRGDEVPADLEGMDYLREGGSVADEPYDPDSEPALGPPDVVEIDGVKYVKASDGATTEELTNA